MYSSQPFIRFLVPLVSGILTVYSLYIWEQISSERLTSLLITAAMLLIGVGISVLFFAGTRKNLRSLALILLFFFLGALPALLKIQQLQKDFVAVPQEYSGPMVLEIRSLAQKKNSALQYDGRLKYIKTAAGWSQVDIRVLISISDKSLILPKLGSNLLIKGQPLNIPGTALNPDEFDYRHYLQVQGIVWTLYLPENSFTILAPTPVHSISQWPLYFSNYAEQVFRRYIKTDTSFGLIKAMLLGRRGDLGNDLLNSYISAGAVHVLAVSGLHVGILFLFISTFLGQLRKNSFGRYVYLSAILFFLAFYAVMTGLSPSVVRASLMCATFAVSQTFLRKNNGLNTLAISAFLILLLDPFALFTVGFQLSYGAVLGIILFYPLFKNVIVPKSSILRWLWQITLVCFTAQIFTFPISLYYFHQFPTYFWLVNPLVITLTTVLINGAIGLLVVSVFPFTFITEWVAIALDYVAVLMNTIVQLPRQLPHYVINSLSFDKIEVMLLFIICIVCFQLFRTRDYAVVKWVAFFCFVFFNYSIWKLLDDFTTPKVNFHAIPHHTVLSFTEGQHGYILSDKPFSLDSLGYNFHIKNYFVRHGIKQVKYATLPDKNQNQQRRVTWGGLHLGFDVRPGVPDVPWTVIRNRAYPGTDVAVPPTKTLFILSPELGYKTRERWKVLLNQSQNNYYDATLSGSLKF